METSKETLVDLLGTTTSEDLPHESQSALQADLDQLQYDTLLVDLNIYGKARPKTLSGGNHTSAWLKAPPLAGMGLSIPTNEATVEQEFG